MPVDIPSRGNFKQPLPVSLFSPNLHDLIIARFFMKKLLLLSCILLFTCIGNSYAQCPGCVIDYNCVIPGGGLCPDSLPGAVYGQPYSEEITFYLPNTVYVSQLGQNLPLINMKINAISGLPFGLNWECDNSGNGCNYNPSQSNHGCVRVCGVALSNPGVYNITVFCTGTVNAGILGNQSGAQNFNFQMVVLPDTVSNIGFSMAPPLGCAPLTVTFQNNFPSNGYQPVPGLTGGFVYQWDFGNGQQSNVENPPPITYYNPGDYPVHYTAIVDTFGFHLTEVTLTSVNCTDPFGGCPDPYIKIFDASNNLVYSNENNYFNNTCPPITITLPNNGIHITNPPYRIEVWDYDCCDPNDECYHDTGNPFPYLPLSLPPVNNYGTSTLFFSDPNNTSLTFNYKYVKNVFQVDVYDTVRVFALPPVADFTLSPGNVVCDGDSILLSVYGGHTYEWFFNDSILIVGATTNQYYATQAGNYKVRIIDPVTGCSSISNDTTISFYPAIPGNFDITFNTTTETLNSNISGFTFQWLIWNGNNYVQIPGANGTSYTPLINSQYALVATNSNGCTDTAFYNLVSLGIENESTDLLHVYLYPNPAYGSVNIELSTPVNEEFSLVITDVQGKQVYGSRIQGAGNKIFMLDLSSLVSGMYSVELRFSESSIRKKLMISR